MLRVPRSILLVAAALAVAAAGCSGAGSEATTTTAAPVPTTEVAPATSTSAPAVSPETLRDVPGRLVVLDDDGNVATMRADGSGLAALTDDAGPRLEYTQPTWSPDGTRVAWTRVDGREEGAPVASVLTAEPDGNGRTEADTPLPVFYMFWDPTGRRIAYLHSGVPTLEMGVVDVAAGGDEAATVDSGQPYYFSWSPDGASLLAHVGTSRLDVVAAADGAATFVSGAPGTFQAPTWAADGSQLYALAGGGEEQLVLRDPDGSETELLTYEGFIWFLLSPDGSQVAFQVLQSGDQGGVTASLRAAQPAPAPVGALAVLDVASGEIETLTADSAVGFFWSPAGTLLSLHLDAGRSGWFRWRVWGDEPFAGPAYQPSLRMARDYLPFFDQYAQSYTPWAPDGSAFAYAGRHDEGQGIWVQPLDPDAAPVRVADGTFAAWSPAG